MNLVTLLNYECHSGLIVIFLKWVFSGAEIQVLCTYLNNGSVYEIRAGYAFLSSRGVRKQNGRKIIFIK